MQGRIAMEFGIGLTQTGKIYVSRARVLPLRMQLFIINLSSFAVAVVVIVEKRPFEIFLYCLRWSELSAKCDAAQWQESSKKKEKIAKTRRSEIEN